MVVMIYALVFFDEQFVITNFQENNVNQADKPQQFISINWR